jgi:hypothetical protein
MNGKLLFILAQNHYGNGVPGRCVKQNSPLYEEAAARKARNTKVAKTIIIVANSPLCIFPTLNITLGFCPTYSKSPFLPFLEFAFRQVSYPR